MKKASVKVGVADGFDARGIAMLVQTASRFEAKIRLTDGVKHMNAKSLMGMMALGLTYGDELTIEAEGTDEEDAVKAMAAVLEG